MWSDERWICLRPSIPDQGVRGRNGALNLGGDYQRLPRPTRHATHRAAKPRTLENYAPFLEKTYPTVRAVVVSRGDCAIFEYYRKDIGADTLLPVYSVTKSVLSILVGIAIDKGYLRLDEKLPEAAPDAFGDKVDQRARDITIRDFLTKTEGFAESGEYTTKVSYPDAALWRLMLNRPVKIFPGNAFSLQRDRR